MTDLRLLKDMERTIKQWSDDNEWSNDVVSIFLKFIKEKSLKWNVGYNKLYLDSTQFFLLLVSLNDLLMWKTKLSKQVENIFNREVEMMNSSMKSKKEDINYGSLIDLVKLIRDQIQEISTYGRSSIPSLIGSLRMISEKFPESKIGSLPISDHIELITNFYEK